MKPIKPTTELEQELVNALAELVLENKRLRDVVEMYKEKAEKEQEIERDI